VKTAHITTTLAASLLSACSTVMEGEVAMLMIGRWAGDRVVVQGDYSEVNDKAHISDDELGDYREISSSVMEMLKITGRKV